MSNRGDKPDHFSEFGCGLSMTPFQSLLVHSESKCQLWKRGCDKAVDVSRMWPEPAPVMWNRDGMTEACGDMVDYRDHAGAGAGTPRT